MALITLYFYHIFTIMTLFNTIAQNVSLYLDFKMLLKFY